jgi:toxin ParE1/3/4
MNITWSPESIEDLASLRAYIAEDDPAAAQRAVLRIIQSIEQCPPGNATATELSR